MFALGSPLPLAPSLHYNPVNRDIFQSTFATSMKREPRQQHHYYSLDPPGLLDEIAAAVAPLTNLTQRVNLYDFLDRDKEAAVRPLWRQRLINAMEELKKLGINEKAMSILAKWQSSPDRVFIQGLARGYLAAKHSILEQQRMRRAFMYYLKRIAKPSILPRLLRDIEKDNAAAEKNLTLELVCSNNALKILRRNGAKLTSKSQKTILKNKPRDPSTAQTVRELHLLLTPTQPSRNARAKIIYQLLKIVDPEHAPDSPSSIRTGYR